MADGISIAILAGGQSLRMGANKAFVRVGGRPIIERIVERVRPLGGEVVVIAAARDPYLYLGLPVYSDLIPAKGPLGGLHTAISVTRGEYTLVVSCDQPFLNPALLQALIDLRPGYDVVVPLARDGYPQSMHAVYGKGCLDAIWCQLEADRLKVIGFFPQVRVREVAGDEIDRLDPERLSFVNVNTPADLAEAEKIAARLG